MYASKQAAGVRLHRCGLPWFCDVDERRGCFRLGTVAEQLIQQSRYLGPGQQSRRVEVGLTVWVHSSIGGLDAETVLCPTNTELWAVKVNEHRSGAWRRDTRAGLRRVGRAVNPDGWPAVPQSLNRPVTQIPYGTSEEQTFKLVAGLTGYKHRPARMWIAAGSLGAGLAGPELGSAQVDDVVEQDDRLAVRVRGRNSRIVPVRACWTDSLKEAVAATKAEQPADSGHRSCCCSRNNRRLGTGLDVCGSVGHQSPVRTRKKVA